MIWIGMCESIGVPDPKVHVMRDQENGSERRGFLCGVRARQTVITPFRGWVSDVDCRRCSKMLPYDTLVNDLHAEKADSVKSDLTSGVGASILDT